MRPLEGRVAIVTGAAQGIGRAIAVKLAEQGAELVLVDQKVSSETAEEIGRRTMSLVVDVSSDDGWARMAKDVDQEHGRVDIVVNNAAYYPHALLEDLTFDIWHRTIAVNLDACFLSAKYFIPMMRKRTWGRMVNISSNSIGTNSKGMSHYMASKMGILGFTRGLANEVADDGITVNAVLPAITNTAATAGMPEEARRSVWQQQAIQRFAEPMDIAGPVAFLCGNDAAFITGQSIVADGGMYKIS
ncbi:3-oxoacyl-[acyl-carrier protein] reductase [Labilithrix luteola]|uniref:3-oxoacyl-[acyl-carrier protein] reductase n=1 Tax=Labilithrix luteola TaxID=1391654 RepID=A0A0K1QH97_9BACT|nr:SDR family oxidoreductase [Labilithrix luteola]AKV04810.1 3-oxoacyl-[acyl-carrier protein] reductase [Labilithrix luteola]